MLEALDFDALNERGAVTTAHRNQLGEALAQMFEHVPCPTVESSRGMVWVGLLELVSNTSRSREAETCPAPPHRLAEGKNSNQWQASGEGGERRDHSPQQSVGDERQSDSISGAGHRFAATERVTADRDPASRRTSESSGRIPGLR